MRHLLSLLFFVLSFQVYAQTPSSMQQPRVQRFEVEVFLGGTYPISHCLDLSPAFDLAEGVEFRYNLQQIPLSVGFLAEQTNTRYGEGEGYNSGLSNCMPLVALTGDWNFRQGKKINPFAGLAMGITAATWDSGMSFPVEHKNYPVFIPRIGVELGYHFRTHLDINIVRTSFSNVQLAVGANIGGRPKKQK